MATGYLPELRAAVVFTVQDVLADPPFSRLDLVSCRNLLIYLRPEAQAKVISLFHFALRDGGVLLLGNSETVGNVDGRFEVISKPERVYRHIGHSRPGRSALSVNPGDGCARPRAVRSRAGAVAPGGTGRPGRRLVLDTYAPAAVLINRKHECLYSLGPTDRYLRVAGRAADPRSARHGARRDCGPSCRSAIQQAARRTRAIVDRRRPGDPRRPARGTVQHRRAAGAERR